MTENKTDTPAKPMTPAHLKRAATYRRLADNRTPDERLFKKWAANKHPAVDELAAKISELTALAVEIAEAYEGLPPEAVKTSRTVRRATFDEGARVRVKEKHAEDYAAICSSPVLLIVVTVRDAHVMVEDSNGARFFAPRRDLEAAPGEDTEEEEEAA